MDDNLRIIELRARIAEARQTVPQLKARLKDPGMHESLMHGSYALDDVEIFIRYS
jgi:hypothetical protein